MKSRSLRFSKYVVTAAMLSAFFSPAYAEEAEEPTISEETIPAPSGNREARGERNGDREARGERNGDREARGERGGDRQARDGRSGDGSKRDGSRRREGGRRPAS